MQHTIQHVRRGAQRGQAIVVMAVAMAGLLAFVALALDGGRYFSQRRTAQNAADMSALAAIYKYAREYETVTERTLLYEINRVAELNGIADTDATLANGVNGNVEAWWVDGSGDVLDVIDDDPAQFAPVGTAAVKVRTQIPYQTFLTGLLGQPTTRAEAQSIARLTVKFKRFTDNTSAVFTAGGDCNNLTDRIAHHYADTNSAKFMSDVYVDGTMAVGSVNASDFYGNVEVRIMTGVGPIGGPYSPTANDPFQAGGNRFYNGAHYIAPVYPPLPARAEPDWAWIDLGGGTMQKLDAAAFRPVDPVGVMYERYQYFWSLEPLRFPRPEDFYHYVPGDPSFDLGGGAGTVAAPAIDALYNAGKRGIVYVDGHLTVPAGTQVWEGITLIVNGRFNNMDANHDFYAAGVTSGGKNDDISGMAMNISVLAGADLTGAARCASDPLNWVFFAENNNSQYHGIIYVPYGQINFSGNTAGGGTERQFSDGVVTYSVYLSGNSWQFKFDPLVWVQPIPATELND